MKRVQLLWQEGDVNLNALSLLSLNNARGESQSQQAIPLVVTELVHNAAKFESNWKKTTVM